MNSQQKFNLLKTSPIFLTLTTDSIKDLLSKVPHQFVKYHRKTLAVRGESCDRLMIMLEGSLRAEMMDHKGKVLEVETITPPNLIAPAFIFAKNNFFPVDLVAITPALMLIIPKESLLNLLFMNKTLMLNFIKIISTKSQFLSERLYKMSFKNIKEKLAHYLFLLWRESAGNKIILPITITKLSEYFGVSRPSLSRVIGDLEHLGIIKHKNKEIILTDPEKIKSFIEDMDD